LHPSSLSKMYWAHQHRATACNCMLCCCVTASWWVSHYPVTEPVPLISHLVLVTLQHCAPACILLLLLLLLLLPSLLLCSPQSYRSWPAADRAAAAALRDVMVLEAAVWAQLGRAGGPGPAGAGRPAHPARTACWQLRPPPVQSHLVVASRQLWGGSGGAGSRAAADDGVGGSSRRHSSGSSSGDLGVSGQEHETDGLRAAPVAEVAGDAGTSSSSSSSSSTPPGPSQSSSNQTE